MLRRSKSETETGMPKLGLLFGTALASVALAGCTASAPPAETSFSKAQTALASGKVDRAVTHAEQAVLASPRSGSYRALLGAAYLEAGRFEAASTSFADALELGETDPRTVLSYALAKIALGDNASALAKLREHEGAIPAADYGLAIALAGEPERGTHVLVNAVRMGEGHAKTRQNLAYAYALAGNWPAARVMAAEDVPAGEVDMRIARWAETIAPEAHRERVASLLGVTTQNSGDMPGSLALANFPSQKMMVAEAQEMRADELNFDLAQSDMGAESEAAPSETEALAFGMDTPDPIGPVETVDPSDATMASIAKPSAPAARAIPTKGAADAPAGSRFVSNAVVQDAPQGTTSAKPTDTAKTSSPPQRRAAIASSSSATHLVQLGSYDSRDVAKDKWAQFNQRFPQLAGREAVITEAVVNGRTYFRLAASGFGRRTAQSLCDTVKRSGRGCFTYAASSPPAGAVKSDVRVAARTS